MTTLKYLITAAMAASIAFASCTEEITTPDETGQEDEQLSQEPGDPIVFGVSTGYDNVPDAPETKADFSGATFIIDGKKHERIDWEIGDTLEIYCPQASAPKSHKAEYKVIHYESASSSSLASITPSKSNYYLRWGKKEELHLLYAFYPKLWNGTSNGHNKILSADYSSPDYYTLEAEVPQIQSQNNKPIMTAAESVVKSNRVNLNFSPAVNTFDIKITNKRDESIIIDKVELVSTSGNLSGKYGIRLFYYSRRGYFIKTYDFNETGLEANNRVEYSLPHSSNEFAPDEDVTVRLYTLPANIERLSLVLHLDEGKMSLDLKDLQGKWITFNKEKKYNFNIQIPQSADIFNYTLETSADTLYFSPFIQNYPRFSGFDGGGTSINVKSYRKNTDGTKQYAVPFRYDNADWLDPSHHIYLSHPGSLYPNNNHELSPSIKEFDPEDNEAHTSQKNTLRNKPEVSNYDLSTNGGTSPRNTANCYVVRQRGTYKFPAVCGNIIKNDQINLAACRAKPETIEVVVGGKTIKIPPSDPTMVLQEFVDGRGRNISTMFTPNPLVRFLGASKVSLVWEDTKGLIERLSLDEELDMQYVHFKIGDNIDYGNALIAAEDGNGKIIWTWHIWVTDVDFKMGKNGFLSVPLGYRPQLEDNPADIRSFVLKQDDIKGKSKTIYTKVTKGYTYPSCLYYKSGMMRPLIPTYRMYYKLDGRNHDQASIARCYTGDFYGSGERKNTSEFRLKDEVKTLSLEQAINSPSAIFNLQKRHWNLWNNRNTNQLYLNMKNPSDMMEKTVYDPCPVGYQVPKVNQLNTYLPAATKERFKMGGYGDAFVIVGRGLVAYVQDFSKVCYLLPDWGDPVHNQGPYSPIIDDCPIIPVRDNSVTTIP